jgi:hypothetical protein
MAIAVLDGDRDRHAQFHALRHGAEILELAERTREKVRVIIARAQP